MYSFITIAIVTNAYFRPLVNGPFQYSVWLTNLLSRKADVCSIRQNLVLLSVHVVETFLKSKQENFTTSMTSTISTTTSTEIKIINKTLDNTTASFSFGFLATTIAIINLM